MLSHGDYQKSAVVLVQCQAPQELLLGMDLMEALGIRVNVEMEKPSDPAGAREKLSMRLLDAVRVPARHGCLVRATIKDVGYPSSPLLVWGCGVEGESMEPALIEISGSGVMTLIVQNEGLNPIQLDKDSVLEHAENVAVTWSEDQTEDAPNVGGTINALNVASPELTTERKAKLCTALQMD